MRRSLFENHSQQKPERSREVEVHSNSVFLQIFDVSTAEATQGINRHKVLETNNLTDVLQNERRLLDQVKEDTSLCALCPSKERHLFWRFFTLARGHQCCSKALVMLRLRAGG